MSSNLSLPFPDMHPVPGVRMSTTEAGVRYANRKDLVLFEINDDASVASVFTKNRFCAAPVTVARQHLSESSPRYFLINTGNANAGTGSGGIADANACCDALARKTDCAPEQVVPFSTGVIGEPLAVDKITAALADLTNGLADNQWRAAAEGIMTTDTCPKGASTQFQVGNETITITGIAKGAGMIHPNMATMLSFIFTDAKISQPMLQEILSSITEYSFNSITVDGDTSTNDACMLAATGQSGVDVEEDITAMEDFRVHLLEVMTKLAQAIIRDAEGVTKFVTICVEQAKDYATAKKIAYTIALSPLVKTALFASDPNWGRILAAIGRAPVADFDLEKISVFLGDVCIVENGGRSPGYREEQGAEVLAEAEITIRVVMGEGSSAATVWTSDLSHEYVTINAEYRT